MPDIEFNLIGVDEAMRRLRAVAPNLQNSGLRAAGTKAMRIVRDSARQRSKTLDDPATASTIWKKIVTRYNGRASKREGGVVVQVGVQGGAKPQKGDHDTGHWRFLEMGTSQMAAQPFMRPALEGNVHKVADTFVKELGPQIDKAVERAKRRGR
jgi:HK97 gp10 family phage protein